MDFTALVTLASLLGVLGFAVGEDTVRRRFAFSKTR
jgi:hypothetical protein